MYLAAILIGHEPKLSRHIVELLVVFVSYFVFVF
jgi:hypothetical protein